MANFHPWILQAHLLSALLIVVTGEHANEDEGMEVEVEDGEQEENYRPYVLAHGAMMAGTWILLIPGGILVARHSWLLELGSSSSAMQNAMRKARIPFISIFMSLATCAMIAAFIIPFRTFTKGMHISEEPDLIRAHAVIGILVMSLVGFHAVMAMIRPRGSQPNAKAMRLWTFIHAASGYATAGLAVSNVYIGINVYSKELDPAEPLAAWYVPVTVVLACMAAAGIVLEVGKSRWEARTTAQLDEEAKPGNVKVDVEE